MSSTTVAAKGTTHLHAGEPMTTTDATPIAGPSFRAVAAKPCSAGERRRLLLCLIAAYQDAGAEPRVRHLAARLKTSPAVVDTYLDDLVAGGYLEVAWAKDGAPGKRSGDRLNAYKLVGS